MQIEFLDKDSDQLAGIDELNKNSILRIVEELLDDRFSLRDIAILCRTNVEANLIAAFLIKNSYNVISSESLLIKNSPDVQFLIDIYLYHIVFFQVQYNTS